MNLLRSLGSFLSTKAGKSFYNYAYCWGACLVIAGAIFKIMHLPYDDLLLMVGMGTEVFIFFISGFEPQSEDYHWENVFPELVEKSSKVNNRLLQSEVKENSKNNNEQLLRMNDNLDGLNQAYEVQIKSIYQQIDTLNKMNESLVKIKSRYEGALENSDITAETEKMSKQMMALNQYYSRMLHVMNVQVENK